MRAYCSDCEDEELNLLELTHGNGFIDAHFECLRCGKCFQLDSDDVFQVEYTQEEFFTRAIMLAKEIPTDGNSSMRLIIETYTLLAKLVKENDYPIPDYVANVVRRVWEIMEK